MIAHAPAKKQATRYYARYFGDPDARLFWRDEQLYCGLLRKRAAIIRPLLNSGLLGELADEGLLLRFECAEALDNYDLCFRFPDFPRVTYNYEWSSAMWKEATLHLLMLLDRLAKRNLTLRNPHPWNVLFEGHRPVYIHPGSITASDAETFERACDKISRFLIHPLRLHVAGKGRIARRLLHDIHDGISPEDASALGLESWPQPDTHDLTETIRRVSNLAIPDPPTLWNNYYTPERFQNGRSWALKQQELERLIVDAGIRTMTDVAGNVGYYSKIAAALGVSCISLDFDEIHVSRLFRSLEADPPASPILPAVMDFTNPSAGYGIGNDWFPRAEERLRSELVIALAVEHHLYFGRHKLTFDEIARGLARFTTRFALVEFEPDSTGELCNRWRPEEKDRYSAHHFATALANHFRQVLILSAPEGDRQRILCSRTRAGGSF